MKSDNEHTSYCQSAQSAANIMQDIKSLESALNYKFNDCRWLERALTHSSTNETHSIKGNYERLEFLGDAVLGLAVAQLLLDSHKDLREGQLSKMRAALVNTKSLAAIARKINICRFIRLSRSQQECGGSERPTLLADVMEAIFGAIYRDSGYAAAFECIKHLLGDQILTVLPTDPKTELQEALHEYITDTEALKYELESMNGPEHQPTFTSVVKICCQVYGRGSGPSKKESQQSAAAEALRFLNEQGWADFKTHKPNKQV